MILKIKIPFTDKYTYRNYTAGESVEFDEERAKELLSDVRGLVEPAEEQPAEEKPKRKRARAKKQAD